VLPRAAPLKPPRISDEYSSVAVRYHPAAAIFLLIQGDEFDALVADIGANGLREAVTLHLDGRILDGRNRHRACQKLGIEPRYRTWNGRGSELKFVLSLNLLHSTLQPHKTSTG
jgi:hypothetical protein